MKLSRRQALLAGAAAGASAWSANRAHGAANANGPMPPLDYGRSFLCNTAPFNSVRFWIESRTRLIDIQTGSATDYYQCASCKSENTFADKDLLKEDNYDFLPIYGGGKWLVFRRRATADNDYRNLYDPSQLWGTPELRLVEPANVRLLDSWEAIRDATAAALPIVTQTTITHSETGLTAIIECPSKTMNISHDLKRYQTDTGPVALPDLTKRADPPIDCLRLAFIAFNAPDFADFVVEQSVPVAEDTHVLHYTKPISFAAQNRVYALDLP